MSENQKPVVPGASERTVIVKRGGPLVDPEGTATLRPEDLEATRQATQALARPAAPAGVPGTPPPAEGPQGTQVLDRASLDLERPPAASPAVDPSSRVMLPLSELARMVESKAKPGAPAADQTTRLPAQGPAEPDLEPSTTLMPVEVQAPSEGTLLLRVAEGGVDPQAPPGPEPAAGGGNQSTTPLARPGMAAAETAEVSAVEPTAPLARPPKAAAPEPAGEAEPTCLVPLVAVPAAEVPAAPVAEPTLKLSREEVARLVPPPAETRLMPVEAPAAAAPVEPPAAEAPAAPVAEPTLKLSREEVARLLPPPVETRLMPVAEAPAAAAPVEPPAAEAPAAPVAEPTLKLSREEVARLVPPPVETRLMPVEAPAAESPAAPVAEPTLKLSREEVARLLPPPAAAVPEAPQATVILSRVPPVPVPEAPPACPSGVPREGAEEGTAVFRPPSRPAEPTGPLPPMEGPPAPVAAAPPAPPAPAPPPDPKGDGPTLTDLPAALPTLDRDAAPLGSSTLRVGPGAPFPRSAPAPAPAPGPAPVRERGSGQGLLWVGVALFAGILVAGGLFVWRPWAPRAARGAGSPLRPPKVEAPRGLPPNLVPYLEKAQAGDASAMRYLGVCYYNGLGVAPDREEGLRWYRKAAQAGSQAARSELAQLEAAR